MKSKVAIVYSDYYKDITNGLLDGFNNSIDASFECDEFKVNGSWEIIYKINSLIDKYDKFVAIGVIVKGETDHYEFLSSSIANQLLNLTTLKNVYISNCILNVLNIEQATVRAGSENNKGSESALALNNLFIT
jgi:6,7-dimethyl-8-ribityllumazine synthase